MSDFTKKKLKLKKHFIAPIASLDTEALGGVQTRAYKKDCVFRCRSGLAVARLPAAREGPGSVVRHYAQSYCSLGSDTRHSGEVIGGEGCCVLAPDWSTS